MINRFSLRGQALQPAENQIPVLPLQHFRQMAEHLGPRQQILRCHGHQELPVRRPHRVVAVPHSAHVLRVGNPDDLPDILPLFLLQDLRQPGLFFRIIRRSVVGNNQLNLRVILKHNAVRRLGDAVQISVAQDDHTDQFQVSFSFFRNTSSLLST